MWRWLSGSQHAYNVARQTIVHFRPLVYAKDMLRSLCCVPLPSMMLVPLLTMIFIVRQEDVGEWSAGKACYREGDQCYCHQADPPHTAQSRSDRRRICVDSSADVMLDDLLCCSQAQSLP